MADRVSLDLLYLQLIEELDLSWMTADSEIKLLLSSYEAKKQKKEVSFCLLDTTYSMSLQKDKNNLKLAIVILHNSFHFIINLVQLKKSTAML